MVGAERSSFIGRQGELAALTETLQTVFASRDHFTLISGEPGIGKTRLCEELVSIARETGASVAWGRCSERTTTSSFWPWAKLIETLVRGGEPDRLLNDIGATVRDLSRVVPSLRNILLDEPLDSVAADPATMHFRIADAVVTFLKYAAEPNPLVLVIEDLQWADSSSLLLLEHLIQAAGDS